MATAALASVRGSLYGAEEFSFSMAFANATDTVPLEDISEALVASLTSTMADSTEWGGVMDTTTHILDVVLATINLATGEVGVGLHSEVDIPGLSGAGGGGTNVPPQVAIAVSLTADEPAVSGKVLRGRYYLPNPVIQMTEDGRFNTAKRDRALAGALSVASGVADLANVALSVWSRKDHSVVSAHTIRVGRVADTIRSRRSSLQEDYATDTWS